MIVTTKKGDGGKTSLYDGSRVDKTDLIIELNGELDECNALLGLCKVMCGEASADAGSPFHVSAFETIQRELMDLMALIARDADKTKELTLSQAVGRMEAYINKVAKDRAFKFVLPGRDRTDALLHIVRTKVRTCERRLVALMAADDGYAPVLRVYLNRLSDYLFCMILDRWK